MAHAAARARARYASKVMLPVAGALILACQRRSNNTEEMLNVRHDHASNAVVTLGT